MPNSKVNLISSPLSSWTSISVICILLTTLCHHVVRGKVEITGKDGFGGTISFGQDMNDEGDFSEHLPDVVKCDACKLLAKKITEKFDTIHKKRPSLKNLVESEILAATDDICHQDQFKEEREQIKEKWKDFQDYFEQDYGVKEVKKVKRLSGPGLAAEREGGVTQSGGQWPRRLMKMCKFYMGELDEVKIYEQYKKHTNMEKYLCFGKEEEIRGECIKLRSAEDNINHNGDL